MQEAFQEQGKRRYIDRNLDLIRIDNHAADQLSDHIGNHLWDEITPWFVQFSQAGFDMFGIKLGPAFPFFGQIIEPWLWVFKSLSQVINDHLVQFMSRQRHGARAIGVAGSGFWCLVISIALPFAVAGLIHGVGTAVVPENQTCQWEIFYISVSSGSTCAPGALTSDGLHLIPERAINDGFVLARVPSVLIEDFSDVCTIPEQLIERIAIEVLASMLIAISADVALRPVVQSAEILKKLGH